MRHYWSLLGVCAFVVGFFSKQNTWNFYQFGLVCFVLMGVEDVKSDVKQLKDKK